MPKICKDGRVWGQTNKEAGNHLGILTGRKVKPKKGFNSNSKGRPFKKGVPSWMKGKKMSQEQRGKLEYTFFKLGKEHPNWRGGISFEPYPLGWDRTHKEQIRYRDGYKCQICGVPEVECKKRLCIHHIDYDKKNINLDNLISLCARCHSKTNFNRVSWMKYFINQSSSHCDKTTTKR